MSSSTQIVWWHFSDVHWKVGASSERARFLDALWSHLRKITHQLGPPDFIVISGDIAYSGSADEYADVRSGFIEPLVSKCCDVRPPLFVVPGNHDLSRPVSRYVDSHVITSINSKAQLDEFLDDPTALELVERPFKAFLDFSSQVMSAVEQTRLSWSASLTTKGRQIRLVGAGGE